MTDSRRDESDPTQQLPYEYPGYTDPAYANQASYGPSYQAPPQDQTQQLPPYSPYTYQPPPTEQFGSQQPPGGAPPEPPDSDGPTTGCGCGRWRRCRSSSSSVSSSHW
jgi:hypothetical protein